MATTPRELAHQTGVDQRTIRVIPRRLYRPNGENKNARWVLDDEMVVAVLRELSR